MHDKELQKIGGIKTNGNVLPQPSIVVSPVFKFPEGEVVVIEVKPSLYPPVRYKGRCWIRVGPRCLSGDIYSFKIMSIFNTIINDAAEQQNAEVVLIDVGPNLGAINKAVAISSDYIIIPVASDLFSLQDIKDLGITLNKWKKDWQDRIDRKPQSLNFDIPKGKGLPAGYIVMQHTARESRPVKSYLKWANCQCQWKHTSPCLCSNRQMEQLARICMLFKNVMMILKHLQKKLFLFANKINNE